MQPDFRTLPEVVGCPGLRWVGTTMMDEEQYRVEGWYLSGPMVKPSEHSYEVDHPTRGAITVSYWRAPLPWPAEQDGQRGTPRAGLRGYGLLLAQRREERKAAARSRREADDEWSQHIESLVDAKPEYPR